MTTKQTTIFVGVLLIGAISVAVYKGKDEGTVGTSPTVGGVTTSSEGVKGGVSGIQYGYTTQKATSTTEAKKTAIPTPSISYAVVAPASFSNADAELAVKTIQSVIARLKENPENAGLWAELGFHRKGIEDYVGAKEALEYSLALSPYNATVADNLGVVYGDYLKDPQKAEKYYLIAVELEPNAVYRYLRLFEFYSYITKDMAKAKAILERGLKAVPGETSLKTLLESL
ncbi:MAG: hypothetical protein Q7R64_04450 [bacterium]|nr:hypothetical protein [bacterium]